jgi:quercetin dioxygenase-like cupin family protein
VDGEHELVPEIEGSAVSLASLAVAPGSEHSLLDPARDSLLYVVTGSGSLAVQGETHALASGAAALVLAGEQASLEAREEGLSVLRATVGPGADTHAALGPREVVVDAGGAERATGSRSFRVFLGPHNGSTHATLFAGFVPPGRAPWHFHLYDEIVWLPQGPGRLHVAGEVTELGPGAAFRLRPRQPHVVENTSSEGSMTVIGFFTPAGSPAAAYLVDEPAAR